MEVVLLLLWIQYTGGEESSNIQRVPMHGEHLEYQNLLAMEDGYTFLMELGRVVSNREIMDIELVK